MEANPTNRKKKYNIFDFATSDQGKLNELKQCKISCICNNSSVSQYNQCKKCSSLQHVCLQGQSFIGQCLRCVARYLDPMFTVKKSLVQTFFQTQDVQVYTNKLILNFQLDQEDLKYGVQIRGLYPGNKNLNWPMQGCFYLNNQSTPFHDIKPLLFNTNRKLRKQDYILISKDKLKLGKNKLIFFIPRLKSDFCYHYKIQSKGVYFFGIYSILKLSKQELVKKTIKQNQLSRQQSIQFLNSFNSSDFEFQNNLKISLICPYTKERIKVPVRGKNCRHFSCMCLHTLIAHHQILRTWFCPICGEERVNQPFVDMWIYQLLHQSNIQSSQVILSIDGTHQWIRKQTQIYKIDDDDDDDDDDNFQQEKMIFPENTNVREIHKQIPDKDKKAQVRVNEQIIILEDEDENPQTNQKSSAVGIHKPLSDKKSARKNQIKTKNSEKSSIISTNQQLRIISHTEDVYKSQNTFMDRLLQKDKKRQGQQSLENKHKKQIVQQKIEKKKKRQFQQVQPLIMDTIIKQFRTMTLNQFQKLYVKGQNKKKVPEGLKKIFKEIL